MTGPTQPGWGTNPDDQSRFEQPQMGEMTTRFARLDPGPSYRFGVLGATLAGLGALLLVIAFTVVDWLTHETDDGPSHFSDIHSGLQMLDARGVANGLSKTYFSWLAWLLLVVAVLAALIACVPGPTSGPFRALGAVVAGAGIVLTFLAIQIIKSGTAGTPSYSEYLKHSRLGFYFTVAGFLLVGIGALVGPRARE